MRVLQFLILSTFLFLGCTPENPTPTTQTNVYVAGYEGNVAKIWKNGVATNLTNGSISASASSVFVTNN